MFDGLKPGEHVCVVCREGDLDKIGMKARHSEMEIRDSMAIAMPGAESLFALLVRKYAPYSNTESVIRHKTGVLGIDQSRISLDGIEDHNTPAQSKNLGKKVYETEWDEESFQDKQKERAEQGNNPRYDQSGRFPANTILVHGENCELMGTKKVEPGNGSGSASNRSSSIGDSDLYGGMDKHSPDKSSTYVSEDGKEEVPDWDCQHDCPVELLNRQSGNVGGKWGEQKNKNAPMARTVWGDFKENDVSRSNDFIGDTGGASRFFKQLRSPSGLKPYLTGLIGSPENVVMLADDFDGG